MIIFNRHYKKAKLITFLISLAYTVFPFLLSDNALLTFTNPGIIFPSLGISYLAGFAGLKPLYGCLLITTFGLLLWLFLYSLVRAVAWLFKPKAKK
jgi:hypothetical protein